MAGEDSHGLINYGVLRGRRTQGARRRRGPGRWLRRSAPGRRRGCGRRRGGRSAARTFRRPRRDSRRSQDLPRMSRQRRAHRDPRIGARQRGRHLGRKSPDRISGSHAGPLPGTRAARTGAGGAAGRRSALPRLRVRSPEQPPAGRPAEPQRSGPSASHRGQLGRRPARAAARRASPRSLPVGRTLLRRPDRPPLCDHVPAAGRRARRGRGLDRVHTRSVHPPAIGGYRPGLSRARHDSRVRPSARVRRLQYELRPDDPREGGPAAAPDAADGRPHPRTSGSHPTGTGAAPAAGISG